MPISLLVSPMTAPDGSSGDSASAFELDAIAPHLPRSALFAFPGSLTVELAGELDMGAADIDTVDAAANDDGSPTPVSEPVPDAAELAPELAAALAELAAERGRDVESLIEAAVLLTGAPDTREGREEAARAALALAGRGDRALVPRNELDGLEARIELLEYRGKALTNALERVSFQPLDGGIRDVRDAAQLFGFANEWCFDEDRVRRRFRELAPVYHPDTGVVADRERMTQLIEARALLIHHVRTAYASGAWADQRRR